MAETPSLQIDDDWKKQAQEEKRKLAEKAASAPAAAPAGVARASEGKTPPGEREAPQASFPTLVRSIMTQSLMYLGELAVRGGEQMLNLDMAKYQIDLLGVLETKTKGNLSAEEQKLLDLTLYDLRSRFSETASRYVM
ncbi:MAG TPA: DUF1844 domain-containing protein [Tepidisphaeraceae bacterium]|nr:DUF1844 domain-containing protein [Tepidisphaeraceae bacterium]